MLNNMSLADAIYNAYKDQSLTGAEREANAYNTAEREAAQAWNAQQATLAFAREMEADSTRYQRMVKDMKAAGLNPMLAAGSSAGSVHASPASSSPASSVLGSRHVSGIDLLGSAATLQQLKIQARLADAQVENIEADTAKKQSETDYNQVQTNFFRDTKDIRAVLLGDEHERNQWEKEIGLRGVNVKERNQAMLEQNAEHYNSYLDAEADLIAEQKVSEDVKRQLYRANAREANQNAAYKAAMLEVDKQFTQAKTQEARYSASLLLTEARVKNGIYTPEYIRAICKEAKAEAELKTIEAAYKKGDYSAASKSLQKVFSELERLGKLVMFQDDASAVALRGLPGTN